LKSSDFGRRGLKQESGTTIANHKSQIANWLPAVIWASLILVASSDWFSAAHTRGIIESLFHWLFPTWTPYSVYKAHLVVRKCAHFFEYAVLAIFVMRGFTSGAKAPSEAATNGAGEPAPRPYVMTIFGVIFLCAMVAIIDEVHQHFVPSRTGSPYDVLLDTTGSTCAMLLLTWRKRTAAVPAAVVRTSRPRV
jgi:VanZ family protein